MKKQIKLRISLFIAILISLYLLSSCSTQKQYEKKYQKALTIVTGDTDRFRDACEVAFPRIPIKIIEGIEVIKYDTIEIAGDSIPCPLPTPTNPTPKVVCPSQKTIIQTKTKTDTIEVENTRYVSELISEKQKCKQDVEWWKNSAENCQSVVEKRNNEISQLLEQVAKLKVSKFFGWGAFSILLLINGLMFYFKRKF